MEIYVFNRELQRIGIIDNYASLRWVRTYYRCGYFELHCGFTEEIYSILKEENIICKQDDLTEAAFIETVQLKNDVEGKEIIISKGRFIEGYLSRRAAIAGSTSGNAEQDMRSYVQANCINPADLSRKIPNLELGNLKGLNEIISYVKSNKSVLEELETISNITDLGFRVKFEAPNKKFKFEVYKGIERVNSIFSRDFESILDEEYTKSINNYSNVAINSSSSKGSSYGLDRFEIYVEDSKDFEKVLKERKRTESIDVNIAINSNLLYRYDYDLGDIVYYVSKKWGISFQIRITEVEEVYEEAGFKVNATFGQPLPTLLDKIKKIK